MRRERDAMDAVLAHGEDEGLCDYQNWKKIEAQIQFQHPNLYSNSKGNHNRISLIFKINNEI